MQERIDLHGKDLGSQIEYISQSEWDAAVLSTWFTPDDLTAPEPGAVRASESSTETLRACASSLRVGGLLFVYGAPHLLPAYAEVIGGLGTEEWRLEFKYWIGIQLHQATRKRTLHPAHVGLLLYHKVKRSGLTPFDLDKSVRVPYINCRACGKNTRDWGGKKHLLNPAGSALSDVWTDLPARPLAGNRAPGDVLQRVISLASGAGDRILLVMESELSRVALEPNSPALLQASEPTVEAPVSDVQPDLPLDVVESADCIEFMESLLPTHAHKAFDLVFADPPYNLDKLYRDYRDDHAAEAYLAWCDRWLELCATLLKPGGSMYVLNLPKWALHHARTMDRMLDFRHWVVWQALAEPRGKLLPAHYALLYYTKPGGPHTFNYRESPSKGLTSPIDAPEYCLRYYCVDKRKAQGDDRKVPLTDVWWDIHRIRHKRDRDHHPCQLPEKLMERIITLSSNPGDVVFDPLCGAGTTAIAAYRLGRRYVTTDLDAHYVGITRDKLESMRKNMELNGICAVTRQSVQRSARPVAKKQIEIAVQQLALDLGRIPKLEDVRQADPNLYEHLHKVYDNPRKALGAARVVLRKPESPD